MKRKELLKRLGFRTPSENQYRMIVDTDAKNEADDQFAIMHHLLTPSFDIRGITAAHFVRKESTGENSMEKSYQEIRKVLELAEMDDVPAYRGCAQPLRSVSDAPDSEAVDLIISEAKKDDERPLFIAVQGAMTNIGAAVNKAPEIAEKLTVLWNGGGVYPKGGWEFNLMQDADAVRVVLKSKAQVWQTGMDVYSSFGVSFAEISRRIGHCGQIGKYLLQQLEEENEVEYAEFAQSGPPFRRGENWSLGDNTTIAMVIENGMNPHWYMRKAPKINEDLTYEDDPEGKEIKVYTKLDVRFALEDLFCKMELVYG